MRLLRNLARRRLRTALTITGITIGIWALVVFSSLANQINGLVGMGSEYFADKIVVTDGMAFGSSPMRLEGDRATIIAGLDGVGARPSQASSTLVRSRSAIGFGAPDFLVGRSRVPTPGSRRSHVEVARAARSSPTTPGPRRGPRLDLARKFGDVVGDTVEIRGEPFEVVGILEPTLTAPDATALIPLAAAQEIFLQDLPPIVRQNVRADQLVTDITVYAAEGTDVGALGARIEAALADVSTMTAGEFDQVVRHDGRDLQRDHRRRGRHQPRRRAGSRSSTRWP